MRKNIDYEKKFRIVIILGGFFVPFPGAAMRRINSFASYLSNKRFEVFILGFLTMKGIIESISKTVNRDQKIFSSRKTTFGGNGDVSFENYYCFNFVPYLEANIWIARVINLLFAMLLIFPLAIIRPRYVVLSVPREDILPSLFLVTRILKIELLIDIRDLCEDFSIKQSDGLTRKYNEFLKNVNLHIYRRVKRVVCVTDTLSLIYKKQGIKTVTIPNGADLSYFKPFEKDVAREILGIPKNAFVIIYVGLLGVYYDLIKFITVLQSVIKLMNKRDCYSRPIKLYIIGYGFPYFNFLYTFIKKNNLQHIVNVVGKVQDTREMVLYLSAADLGIIPRVDDPLYDYSIPTKMYEYIATGVPILATGNINSELEMFVRKYDVGLFCRYKDINCLKESLLSFLCDSKILQEKKRNVLRIRKTVERRLQAAKFYRIIIGMK